MIRRILIVAAIVLTLSTATMAQMQRNYNNNRPSWNGYYNGRGVSPGYHYNQRSGWNTITTPSGNWMHYRDGYIPLSPGRSRRYYQYNNTGSYLDTMRGLIYGNGW